MFKSIGKAISKFAAPVLQVGGLITGNPVLSGIGSAIGGYQADRAHSKAQQQAMSSQQAWEAANAARAQEQINLADDLLYGKYAPPRPVGAIGAARELAQGVESGPGQREGGAMGQAEDWTSNYLDWLQNSSDVIYNAQRGRMEGDIRDSMSQAARMLGRRGLSTSAVQSGAANRTMGDIGMARTGLLSQLEAGRHERQGANLGMGTQLTQGLMDRALNMRSAATGQAMNQQTMIPGMHMQQAGQHAARAGAYGNLTGGMLDYYMQSKQPSVQLPPYNTAPTFPTQSQIPVGMMDRQFQLRY